MLASVVNSDEVDKVVVRGTVMSLSNSGGEVDIGRREDEVDVGGSVGGNVTCWPNTPSIKSSLLI